MKHPDVASVVIGHLLAARDCSLPAHPAGLEVSGFAGSGGRPGGMADDLIRYDILVQDALRGVMRRVLHEVSQTGLPGEHHFFVTFETGAPGVRLSNRLRERYPEQMTIVMQYQFWDLKVTDTGFEIGLSFNDIAEKLGVPFSAVRGFYDPSVNFELEFDAPASGSVVVEEDIVEATTPPPVLTPVKSVDKPAAPDGGAQVVSLDSFRHKK
jgi:uncharacterized protein